MLDMIRVFYLNHSETNLFRLQLSLRHQGAFKKLSFFIFKIHIHDTMIFLNLFQGLRKQTATFFQSKFHHTYFLFVIVKKIMFNNTRLKGR